MRSLGASCIRSTWDRESEVFSNIHPAHQAAVWASLGATARKPTGHCTVLRPTSVSSCTGVWLRIKRGFEPQGVELFHLLSSPPPPPRLHVDG